MSMTNKQKKEVMTEQIEKWIKINHWFGETIDKTKDYTDRRFDKKPRIKTNMDSG